MEPIAQIRNDLTDKFGVPRQSGLVPQVRSLIVFEPRYRVNEAFRGIEGWSHLWLVWSFHRAGGADWSPTVRPPRLGGNERVGVFATRSPYRPNRIGLSCVRLIALRHDPELGPVLEVAGADLMDGTPILDIKPYVPLTDCRPEATGGFTDSREKRTVRVECPDAVLRALPEEKREGLLGILREDPRPAYQDDPARVYGFRYAGREVRFRVAEGVLTVISIGEAADKEELE